ncbi:SCP2 sterol-binding domain-containing protein [Rossellomorea aquimaris]|uniref:SCP2 sterol-binding domain-containing protein n=1 Tax=Rossellomorea TaxID=2837508 RepID=UPI001CD34D61|nr:SCP2 sterol-binding domain-containing protein [Rossellomorea aquimaris]MCA1061176.1 SCP2 sterol-binding domain-containing protein [Rossellomorea aquimaris]
MRIYLEKLVDQCHSRYHLRLLFPDSPFILQFQCGERTYGISISNSDCDVLDHGLTDSHFIIKGEEADMVSLLSGEERLSQMIEKGVLEVRGGYRPLLFTESVLWLTRSRGKEPVRV